MTRAAPHTMADETESSSGKKRRIIHWNPDAGNEQATRRWTWKRMLVWGVGGFFALLFAAGIVIRGIKLVRPGVFAGGDRETASERAARDPNSVFVSKAKADQLYELTSKQLVDLKRTPPDHPVQLEQMMVIQKSFNEAELLLRRHEYAKAFQIFEGVNADIGAYSKNIKTKGEAKIAYDALLLKVRDLEIARSLAPGALELALENAAMGWQSMNDGNFTGAKRRFDEGFVQLRKAEQALAEHVRENLVRGQQALSKGAKEEARVAFNAALEKSPANEEAQRGLKRAEHIDRVYALLQQGEKLEQESRFAEAAESYQKAFALDPQSAVAQAGQARATRQEKETKFAAAKAAAEAAQKNRDWDRVIKEVEAALKIYPQKAEMTAMLKSAKENAHKDAVQKSLARGYSFENQRQWPEAKEAYSQTLRLEADHPDARDGYLRAGNVIRALLEYHTLIEAAEQLANKAEFQAAWRRFNDAMNAKPSYLEPSDRVQQLRTLLTQQTQPVDVTFRSDGKTWVSISTFKNLGVIEAPTSVKIVPGDYKIIGRRRGYQDVQMLLQVRNGMPPPTVTVACGEPTRGF